MHNGVPNINLLRYLGVKTCPPKALQITPIYFAHPSLGWLKVNTDGAILGAPGLAYNGGDCLQ